jgi:tetratricopeptide (TPR) repeat protein
MAGEAHLDTPLPTLRRWATRALLPLALLASACAGVSSAQAGLPAKAAAGLVTARHWQSDAVLVSIEAQDYARNGRFFLTFSYCSPSAGTGLWIVSAPGQGDQVKEAGTVNWGTRPIPAEFLDLPAAIAQARRSGMGAAVDHATLRAGSEGVQWEITPVFGDPNFRVYQVAAAGTPQHEPSGQVDALFARAGDELLNQKLDAAIADFTAVIRVDPNRGEAYDGRGQAYYGTGKYDEAYADFTKALQLDPGDAIAYWKLGDVYAQRQDHQRAIEAFTRSIGLDDEPRVYYLRGRQYVALKQWDRALADYDRAIQLNDFIAPEFFVGRAEAYTHQGRYDQAIADLKHALQMDPNDTAASNELERVEKLQSEGRAPR